MSDTSLKVAISHDNHDSSTRGHSGVHKTYPRINDTEWGCEISMGCIDGLPRKHRKYAKFHGGQID